MWLCSSSQQPQPPHKLIHLYIFFHIFLLSIFNCRFVWNDRTISVSKTFGRIISLKLWKRNKNTRKINWLERTNERVNIVGGLSSISLPNIWTQTKFFGYSVCAKLVLVSAPNFITSRNRKSLNFILLIGHLAEVARERYCKFLLFHLFALQRKILILKSCRPLSHLTMCFSTRFISRSCFAWVNGVERIDVIATTRFFLFHFVSWLAEQLRVYVCEQFTECRASAPPLFPHTKICNASKIWVSMMIAVEHIRNILKIEPFLRPIFFRRRSCREHSRFYARFNCI